MAFERGETGVIVPFPHVYGGEFGDEPEPHLTRAAEAAEDVVDDVERELVDALPITVDATGLVVLVFDGDRWSRLAFLPFAPTT